MGIFSRFRRPRPSPPPLRATGGKAKGADAYRELSPDEAQGFLDGDLLFVHSTAVRAAQYNREARTMMIEWLDDAGGTVAYLYHDVPESIALGFLAAGSKGSFCSLTFSHSGWKNTKL